MLALARQLVSRVADESVQRAPEAKRPEIRHYFVAKGGLLRQLAARVIQSRRNGLQRDAGIAWAIADLSREVQSQAPSESARSQFGEWFRRRQSMLSSLSLQFWLLTMDAAEPLANRRELRRLPSKLLLDSLYEPLTMEADPLRRTQGNLAAISVLASGQSMGPNERRTLAGYTGWGGLSIEKVADRLPPQWTPDSSALIHEYYTPPSLCLEVARVLRPYVESAQRSHGSLMALEPSAGVGRFIHAMSLPGYEQVEWTAVEYSVVSATILRALRPDIRVIQGSFESLVAREEQALLGKLRLVVSNPPYGERGASMAEDRHPAYQLRKAYVYFVLRGLDLLAPSGLGVFLIPYGFLTGKSPEYVGYRKRVLLRHHLMAAFRLPSSLFPGANIVTDLLLFRSRGGVLAEVAVDDVPILEGRYFEQYPQHLLGKEIRSSDEDAPKRARFGYEVLGHFTKLPDFVERRLCAECVATTVPTAPMPTRAATRSDLAEFLLPPEIQTAISLGKRVSRYLGLLSSIDEVQVEMAKRQHRELLLTLQDFRKTWGPPRSQRALAEYRSRSAIISLLSAFDDEGEIIAQLRTPPKYTPRYEGGRDDLIAQASFLYRNERVVTLLSLAQMRQGLGLSSDFGQMRSALVAARWCVDQSEWMPETEYLSGSLWPRYDRAAALALSSGADDQGERAIAATQAARLLEQIAPVTLSVIEPDPRLPWVPLAAVRTWMASFSGLDVPELERREHYLIPVGLAVKELVSGSLPTALTVLLGFLNYDYELFKVPDAPKEIDTETGKEESEQSAQTRARLGYEQKAIASFRSFLRENPADAEVVVDAYNRTFRGYIEPTYSGFVTPARWGSGSGQVELRPHQQAGAARLLWHLGGLLGFDVGVGKTFTGIAVIAKLREEGKARRPVVIVPNSIVFQWLKAFSRALPDFRVLVIGAERYIGRSGALVSRTDKAEERATKWRIFQSGGADVALVTYTTFARAAVHSLSRESFAWASPPLLKAFGLEARKAEVDADESSDSKRRKKPKKASKAQIIKQFGAELVQGMTPAEIERAAETTALNLEKQREAERARIRQLIESLSTYGERERAIIQNRIARWANQENGRDADPGIFWEDLGIDALLVDEAQNFKNLWPVSAGPGGDVPKYLGGIETPTQRALDLAVRAYLVRQKNGGSGVYLLSATPAKNSPLEYFSLISYIDGDAWARLGVADTSHFISRYLKTEWKRILDTDLSEVDREVVTGFVNLPELKEIIFRFAEFRTAQDVGLKLPKSEPQTIKVPMSDSQAEVHQKLLSEYRVLIQDRGEGARNKALGILMQLSLVSVHPELITSRPDGGWSRHNWNRVRSISSPKLESCAAEILKRRGCGHIVFVEPVASQYLLRELLVAKGVRRERIAILNAEEAPTALSRQVIAERFNGTPPILDDQGNVEQEGELPAYDVVIANSVAYEGIDLHIRTCMVHHLDLPWEPATLQQRNGRAVRQGNTQSVIAIYYYISQGSIDAARLTIILGKLTWMKDILSSAERETNNPAAGSELSQDELVAFLYSPEELASLRAKLTQKREEEDRRAGRRRAWLLARRIAEHVFAKTKTPIEMGQEDHAIRELVRQLREIPTQTWPWHSVLVPTLLDGTACAFFDLRYRPGLQGQPDSAEEAGEDMLVTVPLWERCLFVADSVQFQVGDVAKTGDEVSLRMANSIEWMRVNSLLLSSSQQHVALHLALRKARPEQFDARRWNAQVDRLGTEQAFRDALERLEQQGIAALSMRHAPDGWKQKVWDYWGHQVLDRLPRSLLVPVEAGPLMLSAAALGPKSPSPLPWTESGFRRFVERAKTATSKWSELNELSEAWFERPFPKGVLGKESEVQLVSVRRANGTPESVPALWLREGLAVTQTLGAEGRSFALMHVASGLAVDFFPSAELAQRFGEWLLTLPLHWKAKEQADITAGFARPERLPAMAKWMKSRAIVPSLAEMAAQFAQE